MSKDDKTTASAGQAGSADDLIKNSPDPNDGGAGELKKTEPSGDGKKVEVDSVPKTQYEEAEKKLGAQGRELGEFRTFFKEVSPLLDKLQEQPELVEAIMDGKVDSSLAQAVLENKVKIEDATTITKAHDEVKKDLGAKKYDNMSPEAIEKMITDKVSAVTEKLKTTQADLKKDIKMSEDRRKFEGGVEEFIGKTTDFAEYAEGVTKWLGDHPDVYDVETAYYAVKGKALAAEKATEDETAKAEAAKQIAANAAGGASQGTQLIEGVDAADTLIAGSSNPNAL